MNCWKCTTEITDDASVCPACGAALKRPAPVTKPGAAMRSICDRYGTRAVLENPAYLSFGIGDLLDDAKNLKNRLKTAMDAGVGRLYLEQLDSEGKPDAAFDARVRTLLTQDAGLGDKAAKELCGFFDEMLGWREAAPSTDGQTASDDEKNAPAPEIDRGKTGKTAPASEIDRSRTGKSAATASEIDRSKTGKSAATASEIDRGKTGKSAATASEIDRGKTGKSAATASEIDRSKTGEYTVPTPQSTPPAKQKLFSMLYPYEKMLLIGGLAVAILGCFINKDHDPTFYFDYVLYAFPIIPFIMSLTLKKERLRDNAVIGVILMALILFPMLLLTGDTVHKAKLVQKMIEAGNNDTAWQQHLLTENMTLIATTALLLIMMLVHRVKENRKGKAVE